MSTNRYVVREREIAEDSEKKVQGGARGIVVSEIMGLVPDWRRFRDDEFDAMWTEYYAKWRGFWMAEHKSYKTERSKLISPLTSMAIDLTAAEIVEAVLGREYWIDLPDNVGDFEEEDVQLARVLLTEDLRKEGFISEFAGAVLNACLYGTGIIKIQVNTKITKTPRRNAKGELVAESREEVQIKPVAIAPGNFVGDPACADIDGMRGCAHEFMLPLHTIRQRQAQGIYYNDVTVGEWRTTQLNKDRGDTEGGNTRERGSAAFITEWYGLIPRRCFLQAQAEAMGQTLPDEAYAAIDEHDMVEVIATVANETHLLRVIETPSITGERLMVSYQHEVVPGRFWGRGVAEKAANIQRAMDAEMRGRIDALAWANGPMFAYDLTRMPPGSSLNAWPGKAWGTRGNPAEVIREFKLTGPDQNSYAHMQELERMGQQATGALDTSGLRAGIRDETAAGAGLAASSFIKRSKRTMFNIENMMDKLVRRVLHLKMQFEPERYPQDYEFKVRGTLGMMAREIEQSFMVNLLSVIGPDSEASMPIIEAIFAHSGSPVKSDVLKALKAMSEREPTPQEQAAQDAALQIPVKQLQKLEAEVAKLLSEAEKKGVETDKIEEEIEQMDFENKIKLSEKLLDLEQVAQNAEQLDLQREDNQIKREALQIQRQKNASK